jgi:hypothetical protein
MPDPEGVAAVMPGFAPQKDFPVPEIHRHCHDTNCAHSSHPLLRPLTVCRLFVRSLLIVCCNLPAGCFQSADMFTSLQAHNIKHMFDAQGVIPK